MQLSYSPCVNMPPWDSNYWFQKVIISLSFWDYGDQLHAASSISIRTGRDHLISSFTIFSWWLTTMQSISLKVLWIKFTGINLADPKRKSWTPLLLHSLLVYSWWHIRLRNHAILILDRYGTIHSWRPIHWCAFIPLELIFGFMLPPSTWKPMLTKFSIRGSIILCVIVHYGLTSHIISSSQLLLTGSLDQKHSVWTKNGVCSSSSLEHMPVATPHINSLNI
jgi:hypothetical protein